MLIKKISCLCLVSTFLISLPFSTFSSSDVKAYEEISDSVNFVNMFNEKDIVLDNEYLTNLSEQVKPNIEFRTYGIRKELHNVRRYTEYSGYRRVSNSINTTSAGGSISSSYTTTFGTSVSGSVPSGVGVNASASVSSGIGYTLNVPGNRRAYLAFRVLYNVESGTEIFKYYDGGVFKVNNYVVKSPIHGEYAIIFE